MQTTPLSLKIGGACALALAASFPAHADDKSDLAALKKLLEQQQAQIERLENRLSSQETLRASAPGSASGANGAGGDAPRREVQFYGILDSGVEHLSNIGSSHNSVTRVPNITGTVASRLGVTASHDIGGGYKAIGTLEAGFNTDDGSHGQGDRIFGRQAFLGVATPYGALTVGRQYSMLLFSMTGSDILGPNIYGLGSQDVYLPNARFDNAVAWQGKVDAFSYGANYSFGRDTKLGQPLSVGPCGGEVAGDSSNCKAWSAMARYDAASFGVNWGMEEQHGGGATTTTQFWNGAAPIALTSSNDTDTRTTAGAYVKYAALKLSGGWLGRKVQTSTVSVKSDIQYLEASYTFSPAYLVDGGFSRITNDDQDRRANLFALRGLYTVDQNLSAYVQMGHINNSAKSAMALSVGSGVSPAAGVGQTGYMVGAKYKF